VKLALCACQPLWAEIDTLVFGASAMKETNHYSEQRLDVTSEELASRMLTKPGCKVVPHIERRLDQELFKQWKVASDNLTTQ